MATSDAAEKLEACEASLSHGGRMGRFSMPADKRSKDDQQLTKITRDSSNMAVEQIKGMTTQVDTRSLGVTFLILKLACTSQCVGLCVASEVVTAPFLTTTRRS